MTRCCVPVKMAARAGTELRLAAEGDNRMHTTKALTTATLGPRTESLAG